MARRSAFKPVLIYLYACEKILEARARPNRRRTAQRLSDGRWIRVLTLVDEYTRECLTLLAATILTGERVTTALSKTDELRAAPQSIRVDKGTQSSSKTTNLWADNQWRASGTHPARATGRERLHRKLRLTTGISIKFWADRSQSGTDTKVWSDFWLRRQKRL
jgi:hypothetical protein